jgi:hypothetical protein
MGTAHATLIFVSSMLGPCIAWMTGIHVRPHDDRQSVPATFATRGFSEIPGEINPLADLTGPTR